jgi:hypothetical protein
LGCFLDHVIPDKPPLLLTPEQVIAASQQYPQGPNQCIQGAVSGVAEEYVWSVLLGPVAPLEMMMAAYVGCMTSSSGNGSSGSGGEAAKLPKPDIDNLDQHALNGMLKRGWTKEEIMEAFESGQAFPAVDLTAGGAPATRYVHPVTGKSVVINNATGKVIHVGGDGFLYD